MRVLLAAATGQRPGLVAAWPADRLDMPQRLALDGTLPLSVQRFVTSVPGGAGASKRYWLKSAPPMCLIRRVQAVSGGELQR